MVRLFWRNERGVASIVSALILTLVATIMSVTVGNMVIHLVTETLPSQETPAYFVVGEGIIDVVNPSAVPVPLSPLKIYVNGNPIAIADENGNDQWDPGEKIRVTMPETGNYAIVEAYYEGKLIYRGVYFKPIELANDRNYPLVTVTDEDGDGSYDVSVSDPDTAAILVNIYYGDDGGEHFLKSYAPEELIEEAIECYKEYERSGQWSCSISSGFSFSMNVEYNTTTTEKKVTINLPGGSAEIQGNIYYVRFETFDITGKPTSVLESVDAPPVVTITAPNDGATFITSSDEASVTVNARAIDDYGVERVEFYLDGTSMDTKTCSGNAVCTVSSSLDVPVGTHVILTRAYDTKGKTGEDSITITVRKNNAPSVEIVQPTSGEQVPSGPVQVRIRASDAEGLSRIELYADDVLQRTWPVSGTSAEVTGQVSLTEGYHTLRAVAVDTYGANASHSVQVQAVVPSGPDVNFLSPPQFVFVPTGTTSTTLEVTFTIEDDSGLDVYSFSIDGRPVVTSQKISGTAYRYDSSFEFTVGTHTLVVTATDMDGIMGTATYSFTVTSDIPPSVRITSPSNGAVLSAREQVNIEATASDDNQVTRVEFYVDGTLLSTDTTPPYTASTTLSEGVHTIRAVAYDNIGQSGYDEVTVMVRGNVPPTVTFQSPRNGDYVIGYPNADVTISVTATDDTGLSSIEIILNGATVQTCAVSGLQGSCTYTTTLAPGTYGVSARAYDVDGQSSTSAITFTVVVGKDTGVRITGISVPQVSWSSSTFPATVTS